MDKKDKTIKLLIIINNDGKILTKCNIIVIINIAFCFIYGEIAQLARATGSYPVGRWFELTARYQIHGVKLIFK